MARDRETTQTTGLTPSLSLREGYHLRTGDIGSPVLGAPIPSRGREPEGSRLRRARVICYGWGCCLSGSIAAGAGPCAGPPLRAGPRGVLRAVVGAGRCAPRPAAGARRL